MGLEGPPGISTNFFSWSARQNEQGQRHVICGLFDDAVSISDEEKRFVNLKKGDAKDQTSYV
jgi:hypothetical protein